MHAKTHNEEEQLLLEIRILAVSNTKVCVDESTAEEGGEGPLIIF